MVFALYYYRNALEKINPKEEPKTQKDIVWKVGNCYFLLRDYEKSRYYLKFIRKEAEIFPLANLYYAKSLKYQGQYDSSLIAFNDAITNANGNYENVFMSKSKQGTISIIFKYNNPKENNGEENASFYSFDMIKNSEESKFSLRKYENKRFQLLKTINEIPESLKNTVFRLGFVNDVKIKVKVTCKDRDISIYIKFDDLELTQILYFKDDSPLKSGYVGIGTNGVKLDVLLFETSPFKLVVSNAIIDNYMRSGTSKPLSPGVMEKLELEKKMKDELSDVSKGKGILGTNFESKLSPDAKSNPKDSAKDLTPSSTKKGLMPATSNAQFVDDIPQTELEAKECDEKKLVESSALLHMQVCLNNKTVESRKKHCLENNRLMDQEECNVSIFLLEQLL